MSHERAAPSKTPNDAVREAAGEFGIEIVSEGYFGPSPGEDWCAMNWYVENAPAGTFPGKLFHRANDIWRRWIAEGLAEP